MGVWSVGCKRGYKWTWPINFLCVHRNRTILCTICCNPNSCYRITFVVKKLSSIYYTPKWPLIICVITFRPSPPENNRHTPTTPDHRRIRTICETFRIKFYSWFCCFSFGCWLLLNNTEQSKEASESRYKFWQCWEGTRRNIILELMINSNWIFGAALLRIKIPSQSITACYAHKVEIKIRFDAKSKWCWAPSSSSCSSPSSSSSGQLGMVSW